MNEKQTNMNKKQLGGDMLFVGMEDDGLAEFTFEKQKRLGFPTNEIL